MQNATSATSTLHELPPVAARELARDSGETLRVGARCRPAKTDKTEVRRRMQIGQANRSMTAPSKICCDELPPEARKELARDFGETL